MVGCESPPDFDVHQFGSLIKIQTHIEGICRTKRCQESIPPKNLRKGHLPGGGPKKAVCPRRFDNKAFLFGFHVDEPLSRLWFGQVEGVAGIEGDDRSANNRKGTWRVLQPLLMSHRQLFQATRGFPGYPPINMEKPTCCLEEPPFVGPPFWISC